MSVNRISGFNSPKSFKLLLFLIACLLLPFGLLQAGIDFTKGGQDRIDFKAMSLDKKELFAFVNQTILSRNKGLGTYGRIELPLCEYKVNSVPLSKLSNQKGKEIKFMSNPSCEQALLLKVLEKSYRFMPDRLSIYGIRSCLMSLQLMLNPIMEYHAIRFEEQQKSDCPFCKTKEKQRLEKVYQAQRKIERACGKEKAKVLDFIVDFDDQVEQSFKQRQTKP